MNVGVRDLARLAEHLSSSPDYRILRRLDLTSGVCSTGGDDGTAIGLVLDVETTGLDASRDSIVELAIRRFRYDRSGVITRLDRPYSWLEDPGAPLDPKIARLTGLTDTDLAGQMIDDATAIALLRSAAVRISHNCAFDRPFVERRLNIGGLAWACTLREISWTDRGFDGNGRSLGWLLAQSGLFHGAHRAAGDVDAVIALLRHGFDLDHGRTALRELIDTAQAPSWRCEAVGAHFDVKDALRRRGYRWNPEEKVWSREVSDADKPIEDVWLAEHVYAPEYIPRVDGPSWREVTWLTRHG